MKNAFRFARHFSCQSRRAAQAVVIRNFQECYLKL
jgi:hypothetical protein